MPKTLDCARVRLFRERETDIDFTRALVDSLSSEYCTGDSGTCMNSASACNTYLQMDGLSVDDNGLLPFDFPELPDLPELPKVPDALITTWWTKAFAPVVDAIPGYTRGEGIAIPGLGFLGNVPLWFIFGYLGPCADPPAPM